MFRRRTCAILRELKVPDVYATSWVPGILKVDAEFRMSSPV
jgi:hypothetical protein